MREIHATFSNWRTVVIPALKIRKNLIYAHCKCWLRLVPFSQCSRSNLGGHKHRYPLSVNPDWQVALFSQKKEKLKWKKKLNTKWSNTRKFAQTLIVVIILVKGKNFEKSICNSPSTTIIKIGISCQVTVVFQMSDLIKFTDVNLFIIVRILFEVKTD